MWFVKFTIKRRKEVKCKLVTKKKKINKKEIEVKKIAVGLAVVMLIATFSVVATACNGYWKDKEVTTVYGTTGSVDIETIKTLYFDLNLQPGEQLCVCWWIKNKGLCPVEIKVQIQGVPGWLKATFYPTLKFKMKPGTKKNVALCIYMPKGTCQNHSDQKFAVKIIFKAVQDSNRFQKPCVK